LDHLAAAGRRMPQQVPCDAQAASDAFIGDVPPDLQ
jgi:hypothetical protein